LPVEGATRAPIMMPYRLLLLIGCAYFLAIGAFAEARYGVPKIRVAMPTQPTQVLAMPIDEYVAGVLVAEMPEDWPAAAIQAQAVAARTYAIYRKAHPRSHDFDVAAGTSDQAYQWQAEYPKAVTRAVKATAGQVLIWDNKPIAAFFHSCCGGKTERASRVWTWAKGYPFYQVKRDPYCGVCPHYTWEHQLGKHELTLILKLHNLAGGDVDHLIPLLGADGNRVTEVAVITDAETIVLPSNRFRKLVGYDRLRSTDFNILDIEGDVLFLGSGYGHGVGLCQWGAFGMAQLGKNYRQILEFYYPGVSIKRFY